MALAPAAAAVAGVGGGGGWMGAGLGLDLEGLAVDEGIGHLAAGGYDDAGEGGAGDLHAVGGRLLVFAVEVGEAQGFDLVEAEHDEFELAGGDAGGLEEGDVRLPADESLAEGAGHGCFPGWGPGAAFAAAARATGRHG